MYLPGITLCLNITIPVMAMDKQQSLADVGLSIPLLHMAKGSPLEEW